MLMREEGGGGVGQEPLAAVEVGGGRRRCRHFTCFLSSYWAHQVKC